MQYDKSGVSRRRVLLGGAACVAAAGGWALANGSPSPDGSAPAPSRGSGAGGAAAPGGTNRAPGRTSGAPAGGAKPGVQQRPNVYRSRPYAGVPGRTTRTPSLRPPTAVRHEARPTLAQSGRRIALTFDDGPHPVHTPAILKVLRRHGVYATFFVVGECGEEYPQLLRQIAREGHVVANHTWTHPELPRLRTGRVRDELGRTCELIYRCTGAPPGLARAPYGAWDRRSLRVCADLGMEPVQWSIDTSDWARPGVDAISSRVMADADAGAIVLSHDGGGDRAQSVRALESYLPALLQQGYMLTPIETDV